jgi:hypothetical protein
MATDQAAPPQFTDGVAPPKRVNVESPCAGRVPQWVRRWVPSAAPLAERLSRYRHHIYAIQCVRDSLARGEAPYASHVFFDGAGVLDDADIEQRALGMNMGAQWQRLATLHAFYLDHGWSRGMQESYDRCIRRGWDIELRYLDPDKQRAVADKAMRNASRIEAQ